MSSSLQDSKEGNTKEGGGTSPTQESPDQQQTGEGGLDNDMVMLDRDNKEPRKPVDTYDDFDMVEIVEADS